MLKPRTATLDIGGAHIKICGPQGDCSTVPFALWRQPNELTDQLHDLLAACSPLEALGATMTGELCDCFATKHEGVHHIVNSLLEAISGENGPEDEQVLFWRTDGRWATPAEALDDPLPCAASNWHALATYAAASIAPSPALLIDIGSTTTDIIPLAGGRPAARGRTDTERLLAGELVYSGTRRTPIASLVSELPFRGESCPIAAEWFATTQDVYVLLGELEEDADATDTCDGRPLTRAAARGRLARMLCSDSDSFSDEDALRAAGAIAQKQLERITAAARSVVARSDPSPSLLLVCGAGESLARRVADDLDLESRALLDGKPAEVSKAAPAFALQVLLAQRVESPI